MSNKRNLLILTAGLIFLLVLQVICSSFLTTLTTALAGLTREPEPLFFSVEGWNSSRYDAAGNFTYTRYRMVDDLLKRYDFHGWSITKVEKVLNHPDREEENNSQHLAHYDLGNGLDFLILELDASEQVASYRVYKH